VDAWHASAKTSAWYSEALARTRKLPALEEWRGDRDEGPTREEWDAMKRAHEELLRADRER
jgi:hypothetical protein